VRHARERKLTLETAERKYLGCTTRELGVHFAEQSGLPAVYTNVIRWVDAPQRASGHVELVAMVSLARHVCRHAHVGMCGEQIAVPHTPLALTPAWRALQPRLFPGVDAKKFEVQAHAHCLTLRGELSGQRIECRPSHAERAAELV
jgi:hypothetical protein